MGPCPGRHRRIEAGLPPAGRQASDNVTTERPGTLSNGSPYRLLAQVRVEGPKAAISVQLNAESLLEWAGPLSAVSSYYGWKKPGQPGLITSDSTVAFHAVRLRLASGNATLLSAKGDAAGGEAKPPFSDVKILKAVFGVPGKQADVPRLVQEAYAKDPFSPIQADDRAMGDPAPGQQKKLVIAFRVGRQNGSLQLGQTEPSVIPPLLREGVKHRDAQQRFRILAARYGAGLTWLDVTPAVRRKVADPARIFRFAGDEAGQDPWFGVDKSLAVWFDCDGKRYVRVVPAGDCTLLP